MASPTIGRRELLGAVAVAVLLALALHWPLPLHMGRDIAKDIGDPLVQAWQVAWDGHALIHQPLRMFQANMFWPSPDSLAFSDALIGYAPAGLIGSGARAAVARYDALFLFAYALCFVGAWLLARELGAGRAGAAVAGAAFAYAPYRMEQDGHLHVISSGGIALSLFLLLRGYKRGSGRTILAGWLVAAWQLSLGFTLGLQLGYVLAIASVVVAVAWWRRGHPALARPVWIATAAGTLVCVVVLALLARPYLRVLHDHPEAHRAASVVSAYSGPPYEFLAASSLSRVWGAAGAPFRGGLDAVAEQTLFPGLAILLLAIIGMRGSVLPRRARRGLALSALALAILSLGFKIGGYEWLYPYRWLFAAVPGWQGIRVPSRLHTLTTLCLALLAAGGAQAVVARARGRWGARAGVACAVGLTLAVLAEGWGFAPHPRAPVAPAGWSSAPAPVLSIPWGAADNRRDVLWSTAGFPQLVNGRASFQPLTFRIVKNAVRLTFPDKGSVAFLRHLGVHSVVINLARTHGFFRQRVLHRSLRGLDLTRERRGGVMLFVLR